MLSPYLDWKLLNVKSVKYAVRRYKSVGIRFSFMLYEIYDNYIYIDYPVVKYNDIDDSGVVLIGIKRGVTDEERVRRVVGGINYIELNKNDIDRIGKIISDDLNIGDFVTIDGMGDTVWIVDNIKGEKIHARIIFGFFERWGEFERCKAKKIRYRGSGW